MKIRIFAIVLIAACCLSLIAFSGDLYNAGKQPAAIVEALQQRNTPQLIKALITNIKEEMEVDEDRYPDLITKVEKYTQTCPDSAAVAILHSMTAEMYKLYFEQNHYRISQRTALADFTPDDIREWPANLFMDKINKEIAASLSNPTVLQKTPSANFKDILEAGKDSPALRPTLYDFLVARAIAIQPSAQLYADWLAFRRSQGNPKAALLVELDYLRYRNNAQTDPSVALYAASLDSLFAIHAAADYAAEIQIARIESIDQRAYRPFNRDSLLALQYAICKEAIARYPNYDRIGIIRNKLFDIESPYINAVLPNSAYPAQHIPLKVHYRNISTIRVEIYESQRNQSDQFFGDRSQKSTKGKLVKSLTFTLLPVSTYTSADTTFQVPAIKNGLYEYQVSVPGRRLTTNHLISVTRLAIVNRAIDKQTEVLVTDSKTGEPLSQASVVWFSGSRNKLSRQGSVKTDNNGLALLPANDKIVAFQAALPQDTASLLVPVYSGNTYNGMKVDHGQVSLFTDRGIYRPGQTVYFKGICFNNSADNQHVSPNASITVTLRDANYKEIALKEFTSNNFGSFNGEFTLPQQGLNGTFTLTARDHSVSIRVEEYKRPSFQATLDTIRGEVAFGDEVTLHGTAKTFSGVALTEGNVTWRVIRRPIWFDRSFWMTPVEQIAEGNVAIAADGTFSFTFVPEKSNKTSRNDHFYTYEVLAVVTDSKGESQETNSFVSVGDVGIALFAELTEKVEKESLSLTVTASTLNGKSASTTGTYRLIELTDLEPYPTPMSVFKEEKTVLSGTFETDKPFDNTIFASIPSGRYRLYLEAKDGKQRPVTYERNIILYSKQDKRPPVASHFWVLEDKVSCLPSEEASFLLGSSDKDAYILYEIYSNSKRVSLSRIKLSDEIRRITIPFQEAWGDGAVAVFTFIKEGKLHQQDINIYRKQPDKRLAIVPITFRDHLQTGSKESWTFRITKADSALVSAEVLAGMYDASLDKLLPFGWNFSPIRPINLWSPKFGTGIGFQHSYESAAENRKYVQVKTFLFDQLDWQGTVAYSGYSGRSGYYARGPRVMTAGNAVLKSDAMREQMVVADASVEIGEESEPIFSRVHDDNPPVPASGWAGQPGQSAPQIRQNLVETAFFYPSLRTNETGDVLINFTLPESNTTWKFQAIAHTADLRYGQLTKEVIASKPLMVLPNLPRFLREGDQVTISTQVLNQLDTKATGRVRLEWFDPANDKPVAGLASQEQAFSLGAKTNIVASWKTTIPAGLSLIGCRIIADGAEGSDGEQHLLPVLSNRILITESTPFYLLKAGEKTIKVSDTDKSRQPFRITLELSANPVWYAVQALPTLTQPDNDNILSWFASYYSNTLATHIANSNPKVGQVISQWTAQGGTAATLFSNLEKNGELKNILLQETPWVLAANNETEQKQRLALLFDMNRADSQRATAWQRLLDEQTPDGGWSWFKGFLTDRQITLFILKGMTQLSDLKSVQYTDEEKELQQRAVAYLDNCLSSDLDNLKKYKNNWQTAVPDANQLTYLYIRSAYKDIPVSAKTSEAIRFYTGRAAKEWEKLSYAGKAETALIVHRNGDTATANAILAWFRKTATSSEESGMYWANNRQGDDYFTSAIDTHCLLMTVFSTLSSDTAEADRLKQWLLNQKRTQNWETVPSSLNAIYAIMLTGSDWLGANNTVAVQWGSKSIHSAAGDAAIGYIKEAISGAEITPQSRSLVLRKEGNTPAWGAVYYQYFESMDKVTKQGGALSVEKKLFVEVNNGTERQLRAVTAASPLRIGDKVVVRLTIRTDRNMNYVSLKDLRAGCFEPAGALSGYSYRDGVGFYRSPKDVSENFFFTRLPKGTFVIEYLVYVSRKGDYTGGVSTIQCMYAPEFVSHTEGDQLRINE